MFFVLSKFLLFLLSPFFWLVLCFAGYFIIKKTKWKKRLLYSGISIFIFFSNTVIYSTICGWWEVPGTKIDAVSHHDVAIVLGGMFEYNSDVNGLSIRRQGDRLVQALSLYKGGKVDKLLITGDSGFIGERGLHEARQVKELLMLWGIPEADILTEETSKNTHENAANTKKLLKNSYPHLRSYVLVTSGIHMKRSLACFETEGLKCTPFSTDLYANQTGGYYWDQYLIPDVSNFDSWNYLMKEMAGYVVYDLAGYID
ncbi:MAG: hypothetical protein A3D92_06800 [Bacteroidetes bacterium RIFCSPHIGHO2_02_FULL_44_7]|nr:MAG: hypothetical protein A3D92_06800 [Bacteroidetes bacterium RIFCSPHIGHO2_02_FULL_44_7]